MIIRLFLSTITFIFLISCQVNENYNKIEKQKGSSLKVKIDKVDAKID